MTGSKTHQRQDVTIIRRALSEGPEMLALANLEQQFQRLEEQYAALEREIESGVPGTLTVIVFEARWRELKEQLEAAQEQAQKFGREAGGYLHDLLNEQTKTRELQEQLEAQRQRIIQACRELEEAGSDPAPLRVVLFALDDD